MTQPQQSQLTLVGCSHVTANLSTREALITDPDGLSRCLGNGALSKAGFQEWLVLNTCNRLEFYVVSPAAQPLDLLAGTLSSAVDMAAFRHAAYTLKGAEAARHLFRVCAGLESQMLGENEILGQVKTAYADARKHASAGKVLNRLVQKSLQAAKWARTNTGISKGQVSIGNIAAELTQRVCGDFSGISILLVGTGEVGTKTAQALISRGASQVTVTGRNVEAATAIAETLEHGNVTAFSRLRSAIANADAVISCTSAPEPVIQRELIAPLMRERLDRPLSLIDLAVPRDIASDVADLANVYLFNLDDLAALANESMQARLSEVERAKTTLHTRADRIWEELKPKLEPA